MRKTNWPPKDEQFLWYRILPAMQPCIAGRPQQRNDACVEVAIAIEQAIGHRQRIDARKPQEITEETKKARLEHELSAILGSLGVQLEGEQELPPALSPEAPMRPGALPPNKINQVWFCEQCHVVDAVQIAKTATYYEVVGAIQASHQAKAPHCNRTNGIAFARVINPAVVTSCKVLAAEVPTWAVEAIAQLMGFSSYQ